MELVEAVVLDQCVDNQLIQVMLQEQKQRQHLNKSARNMSHQYFNQSCQLYSFNLSLFFLDEGYTYLYNLERICTYMLYTGTYWYVYFCI